MKKILLVVLVFFVSITAYAQTFTEADITYSVVDSNDQTVQVINAPCISIIEIPNTVFNNGINYSVIRINFNVFENCTILSHLKNAISSDKYLVLLIISIHLSYFFVVLRISRN